MRNSSMPNMLANEFTALLYDSSSSKGDSSFKQHTSTIKPNNQTDNNNEEPIPSNEHKINQRRQKQKRQTTEQTTLRNNFLKDSESDESHDSTVRKRNKYLKKRQ